MLLGPSGAGKSTLLRALAGVVGAADEGEEAGTLRVAGQDPRKVPGLAGLVMQDPDAQIIMARVGDDVAFGAENLAVAREEIWRRVSAALENVGLDVALDRSTDRLSGGQRQRLALAGALAMEAGLLLLDEPTANLDTAGIEQVVAAVGRACEDRSRTLIVVEHRVEAWLPLVDRVVVLAHGYDGGLLADGPPERVFTEYGEMLAAAGVWVPGLPDVEPVPSLAHALRSDVLWGRDLVIGYDRAHPVRSFTHVGLPQQASTVVTGPNGAGKSTLTLTLAGLLRPLGGTVAAAAELTPARRQQDPHTWRSTELLTRIGTVFQDPEKQFVTGSVRDELAIGLKALKRPPAEVRATVERLLASLRLDRLANANPFTLSGGEQRRLSVATLLATQPEVLVLDEPTFGQDRNTWLELVALVKEVLASGRTVVSVTHDEPFIAAVAQHRLELSAREEL